MFDSHPKRRLARAGLALLGTSVGDAFGERCFTGRHAAERYPGDDEVLMVPGPWKWTDDTAMAVAVYDELEAYGGVGPDSLMARFVERYEEEPRRGYGSGTRRLLDAVGRDRPWRQVLDESFAGEGSYGNGAAMRVAPVGAYFADDYDELVRQAVASATVTHTHAEGIAGAIAIAVATGAVWNTRHSGATVARTEMVRLLNALVPDSEVADAVRVACGLSPELGVLQVVDRLGTRLGATALETVPLVIWAVVNHLDGFGEGVWRTAAAGGDRDTTCAMVGGILAMRQMPPAEWMTRTEHLAERDSAVRCERGHWIHECTCDPDTDQQA